MAHQSFLILALLLCSTIFACTGNPNNPGSGLTGNLSGTVVLDNGLGEQETDHSGATVEVLGTSFRTTSTSDGSWRLENLPAGTYVIKISKDGYTHRKAFGYQFVGGGEAYFYETYLTRLPSHYVRNLTAVIRDTIHQHTHNPNAPDSIRQVPPYVLLEMELLNTAMSGGNLKLQMYVSRNPNVSFREGEYDARRILYLSDTLTQFTSQAYSLLDRNEFTSGERVYIVFYPAAHGSHGGEYFDPELGHEVDSDIVDNPSNVIPIDLL